MIKLTLTNGKTLTFRSESELDKWYKKQPESFDLNSVVNIEYTNPVDEAYVKYLAKKHNKENK